MSDKRTTILFVDDEPSLVELGRVTLEKLGFEVLTALNGREAVSIFSERGDTIDLVILDLSMPQMSGQETFNEMKLLEPNVKVIVSSGFDGSGAVDEMMENGVLGLLQKPYRMHMLQEKVKQFI